MSFLLSGPISMRLAVDLLVSITNAYYRNSRGLTGHKVSTYYWNQDSIERDSVALLPTYDGSHLHSNYEKLCNQRRLNELQARASDFCASINSHAKDRWHTWHDHLKTRIVNKTLIEDLVKGQLIPPTVNEFIISTWRMNAGNGWLESFIRYRDSMLREAQQRLEQSVTMSAHKIIDSLL